MIRGERVRSALLLLALLSLLLPRAMAVQALPPEDPRRGFDGAPLALLLRDELEAVSAGDYERASQLARLALGVKVPDNLEYSHAKVWSDLISLCDALGNGSVAASVDVYELYRTYLDIAAVLNSYERALMGFIDDPVVKRELSLQLNSLTPLALKRLRASILSLAPGGSRLEIYTPTTVAPGSNFTVAVVTPQANATCVRVALEAGLASYSEEAWSPCVPPGSRVKLRLHAPTPREAGLGPGLYEILVVAYAIALGPGESHVVGVGYRDVSIRYLRHRIYFQVPPRVEPGSNASVNITLDERQALNMTIEIQAPNGTVLSNLSVTLNPGRNEIEIPTGSLDPGFYTLLFFANASGPYAGARYSSGLAVLPGKAPVRISVPQAIIGPPFKLQVVIVRSPPNPPGPVVVIVTVDGNPVWRGEVNLVNGRIVLSLGVPGGLIGGPHNVSITYFEGKPPQGYMRVQARVYTLDLALVLGLLVLAPLASGFQGFLYKLSQRRPRSWSLHGFVELYYKIVRALSAYAAPPLPHETLREYYRRVSGRLEGLARPLRRFLLLYEEFLYSKREPDLEEAREAARDLGVR